MNTSVGTMTDDAFSTTPYATAEERRQHYLAYAATQVRPGRTGFLSQIARLERGGPAVDVASFHEALHVVDERQDCSDFSVAGLLRVLYRYADSPALPATLREEIEQRVLDFKYWWDEPGTDPRCYWTENHQIIFHADELLAGQRYRDRTFTNDGKDGAAHAAHARARIRRWMDDRARFGFSEWLSNCYFDEDLLALVNLYDFAEDADIRRRAGAFIDLLLLEMALHSYRGVFGATHGRTYTAQILGARGEGTSPTAKLMFGLGAFNNPASMSAMMLATSDYRCPPLIAAIAADTAAIRCHERHSITVDDAPRYGIRYDDPEDCAFFWLIQSYYHPQTIALSERIAQTYQVRLPAHRPHNRFVPYADVRERYAREIATHGHILDPDAADRGALTTVNIETYRTPDYMLSCAQDYRPGKPGYQQHIWQATLGPDAVVFTNHPAAEGETGDLRPNFWAGNGIQPRAVQHQNVLVCIHRVPADDPFPYSHAYFPRAAFDEITERQGWVCGRVGDGYIALRSETPARWTEDGPRAGIELRTDAPANIWLCELGSASEWGDFARFTDAIAESSVTYADGGVRYHSPSRGMVAFAWTGALHVADTAVPLTDYPRFDNPYCQAAFGETRMVVRHGEDELVIDLAGRD